LTLQSIDDITDFRREGKIALNTEGLIDLLLLLN